MDSKGTDAEKDVAYDRAVRWGKVGLVALGIALVLNIDYVCNGPITRYGKLYWHSHHQTTASQNINLDTLKTRSSTPQESYKK
jgi:hypothetical protein